MELRRWKKIRPVIQAFFQLGGGAWRHKRVDEELVRWAEKRRKAIERASAGGRAKAAKSGASSTHQAPLKRCTSASSTEVEGSSSHSTLCDENSFLGPKDVREAFVIAKGDEWVRSYVDPCAWQDVPERALIPKTPFAGDKLIREGRRVLAEHGLAVLEAPQSARRQAQA